MEGEGLSILTCFPKTSIPLAYEMRCHRMTSKGNVMFSSVSPLRYAEPIDITQNTQFDRRK